MENETLDVSELADLFGVTEKTVRDWAAEGMPVVSAGAKGRGNKAAFLLRDCVAWYFETNHERLELDRQRARVASAQAEKIETENSQRRGELAELEDVAKHWTDCIANTRARLLAMPTKLAPRLANIADAATIADTVRTEIYAALRELSEYRPGGQREPGREPAAVRVPGVAAAAGVDRKPVGRHKPQAKQRGKRRAG